MAKAKLNQEVVLNGISVSEGIAIGSICTYRTELDDILEYQIETAQLSQELERYFSSLNEVAMQFVAKQNRIARAIGQKHAEIYEAYRLIIEDPFFQEEIPQAIRQKNINAESVIRNNLRILEKRFEDISDEYLRERIYDIRGVSRRIIYNLMQTDSQCDFDSSPDNILIARELTPVDSIYFQHRSLKGIATEYGGKTSHAAILAHSLEIAAIVGVSSLMKNVRGVRRAIIDGFEGRIILNPAETTEKKYQKQNREWEKKRRRYRRAIDVPSPSIFGKKVKLMANINDDNEITIAQRYHAEGIGLFRTELPFIAKERFLTEDEQDEIYQKAIAAFPDESVVIRLLDLGGDKFLPFANDAHELNPFLGWRSIRILLSNEELFHTQLKALFRSAGRGNLKIMIPMVSSLEEILATKKIIKDVKKQTGHTGVKIPLGIMVEIPSAAIEIEKLLKEVDFASIGTNDLIQYTLAVDRNNEKVASYYQPLNSAVLSLVKHVIDTGDKLNKEISVCGEMAGDPLYAPLLVALGIRNLSMHPAALPRVKNILLNTPAHIFEHLRRNYKRFDTVAELTAYLKSNLKEIESG